MDIINRQTKEIIPGDLIKSQAFLYRNVFGRIILKLLVRPFVTKFSGCYMNSKRSRKKIKKFISNNSGINMSEYEECEYKSFNEFFTRKIKEDSRTINYDTTRLISPCDSKLSVYKIDENSIFNIKDSMYKVEDLVKNKELANKYLDGHALIFRLTVDDYHRYCYVDSGTKEKNIHIKGVFHTVNPIALEKYNIYKRNTREYTILHTDNFRDVVMVEVGALMVGKIKNHHQEYKFEKAEEKGMFLFGGSTIVMLVDKDVIIDEDLIENTKNNFETIVKYGEGIGSNKQE